MKEAIGACSTFALYGIDAIQIDVQVRLSNGLPSFTIVGLPDRVIAESKERIRSALFSLGLSMPLKKIIVNLSPAYLVKEGSHYDLPIAVAILSAMDLLPKDKIRNLAFIGELSLFGDIISVKGAIAMSLRAADMQKTILCSEQNANEISVVKNIKCVPIKNISQLSEYLKEKIFIRDVDKRRVELNLSRIYPILNDIRGQELAKRSLIIAAAGRHNLLMFGPPGCGKSLIAKRIVELLPALTEEELVEVNAIGNILSYGNNYKFISKRPFKSPHFSCSAQSLIGGGKNCNPGEITLAHNGVLFLDEIAEFSRHALESLRQPMEDKCISIARAEHHITYFSNFQLVATMNQCKCGNLGNKYKECNRAPQCQNEYFNRISAPILDRIDIIVKMEHENPIGSVSNNIDEVGIVQKIESVAKKQRDRFHNTGKSFNSECSFQILSQYVINNPENRKLIESIADKRKLSARSIAKIMSVALTISDLDGSECVTKDHILEASYISSPKVLW